jgi:hypothetical protein
MEKTKKPVTAGILDIVSGAFAILCFITLMIARAVTSGALGIPGMESVPFFVPAILLIIAVPTLVIGIFAILGGVYALQRKLWGLALAGSIAATLFWFYVGIPAIVLTAQSKEEFE